MNFEVSIAMARSYNSSTSSSSASSSTTTTTHSSSNFSIFGKCFKSSSNPKENSKTENSPKYTNVYNINTADSKSFKFVPSNPGSVHNFTKYSKSEPSSPPKEAQNIYITNSQNVTIGSEYHIGCVRVNKYQHSHSTCCSKNEKSSKSKSRHSSKF